MSFLYVKVYYGPCNTFNTNIHKPQLLHGLRVRLQTLGFRVDLLPVDFENYCMLEICGHEVFRCNLKYFKFNTASERDAVSERAVGAVLQASVKFRRARAYLWFWTLMDHQLFRRSRYAPKDFWVGPEKTKTLSDVVSCIKCCDILVTKNKEDNKSSSSQPITDPLRGTCLITDNK